MKVPSNFRLFGIACALGAALASLPGIARATTPFSLLTRTDQAVGFQSTRVAVDLNGDRVPAFMTVTTTSRTTGSMWKESSKITGRSR
jgi:hypothetical protein